MKGPKKQKIVRQISSCLTKKSIEFARKERKNFKPIDIIYKPKKIQKLVHFVVLQKIF